MTRAIVVFSILWVPQLSRAQYVISTVAGGVPPNTPLPAAAASIGDPPRVAVDSAGNLYFGSIHSVFKVDQSGTLTRVAGIGRSGYSGDGGPATSAQLEYPDGIAVDAAGDIFVADKNANVIREIAADGAISTFAGTGAAGFAGDGGPAAQALFNGPTGLAFDAVGNLYVADTGNNRVRRISPGGGAINTLAGNGAAGSGGDGGPASSASLNSPEGVTIDPAGYIYIADTLNNLVRRVAGDGSIGTFAGNGYPGPAGDNGPAANAALFLPTDVAADNLGDLYIADLGTVRIRVVTNGIIKTFAGSSNGPLPADNLSSSAIRLTGPTGLAVDSTGVVYFAEGSIGSGSGLDLGAFKIWKVTAKGIVLTAAGNALNSYSGDNGPASLAQLDTPAGMAFDSNGNLYVVDSANNRVRRISPDGSIVTVAGNGNSGFSGEFGPAVNAALNHPMGIAVDLLGFLYIADTGNNRVRAVDPSGMIYTVAGNGNAAFFGDGTIAQNAALRGPRGVAVDPLRNLYIADTLNHRIREVTLDGILNTVAGSGQGFGGDGGPATSALLNLPSSIALDSSGNLFIADQGNGRIRMLSASGTISTVAGSDGSRGLGDGGPATSARLVNPQGVAVDPAGNLYISDTGENRIREVSTAGVITTIAGNGRCCYSNDGIPAAVAPLNVPWGIAVDSSSNVWVADSGNNAIRELSSVLSSGVQTVVTNGASNLMGPVAPGEIVSIYGSNLGPPSPVAYQSGGGTAAGTQLGGASVTFNGISAPILYASAGQLTAIVPYAVSGQSLQVAGSYLGSATFSISVPLAASAPALFTADSTGIGPALAANQDGSSNSTTHPAAAGSVITLYATGEGQTSPGGIDGQPVSGPAHPVLPVSVTIGGLTALVQSAVELPGSIGVVEITVQVPGGVEPGPAVPVMVQVGGVPSPPGVTISVAGL